jgi:hypothetical protein
LQTSQAPNRPPVPLESISSGVQAVENKKVADERDNLEDKTLANRERRAQINSVEQSNRDKRVNRKLRWRYASLVFKYFVGYSIAVFGLLIAAGAQKLSIPEQVLTTLVGSTAASAIGLVGFVVNGLFKN